MSKVIHFFGGKGGSGVTIVCKSYINFLESEGIKFKLFDADRVNEDIQKLYSKDRKNKIDVQKIVFNEGIEFENSPNILFEEAINNICVVNLPSQILESFNYWYVANDIHDLANKNSIEINYWYVSDGGYQSISVIFEKYLEYFGDHFNTIFVKNFGRCDNWSFFENQKPVQEKIIKYDVKVIDYPKLLGEQEKCEIDAQQLTLSEAYTYQKFNICSLNKIGSFIRRTKKVFTSIS